MDNNLFATHAGAAAGSVALGTVLTYPLDTLKSIVQVGSSPGKHLAPGQVLQRIDKFSGISGLYRGIGWLVPGRLFGFGARFGVYEILTAFNRDGRVDRDVFISEALLAGMAAGALESLVTSPFEIMKLRAQVAAASRTLKSTPTTERNVISPLFARLLRGYSPDIRAISNTVNLISTLPIKHQNVMANIREYPWMMTGTGRAPSVIDVRTPRQIFSLEGIGAYWRGVRSGLVRDSIFGGVFFASWQFLHRAMLDWKAVGMNPPPRSDDEIGHLSPLAVSLAAGFSGSLAAVASHSFDTAKSRSQCIVIPKYVSLERKLLKWPLPGKRFERYAGIHPADRSILFRGIWLRMGRCGIASFLTVGCYYWAVDHLVPS